jgi:hypothetical protein
MQWQIGNSGPLHASIVVGIEDECGHAPGDESYVHSPKLRDALSVELSP